MCTMTLDQCPHCDVWYQTDLQHCPYQFRPWCLRQVTGRGDPPYIRTELCVACVARDNQKKQLEALSSQKADELRAATAKLNELTNDLNALVEDANSLKAKLGGDDPAQAPLRRARSFGNLHEQAGQFLQKLFEDTVLEGRKTEKEAQEAQKVVRELADMVERLEDRLSGFRAEERRRAERNARNGVPEGARPGWVEQNNGRDYMPDQWRR